LESELPICDPHHHFWDFRTERIPYQQYLLHELAADMHSGHNVRSTVFVEARAMYRADGPEEMRPVGEVEFVQGLAAASASGLYGPGRAAAAIVGHSNLNLGERVAPVLDALQAASPNRFRGIRHSVTWDPHPEVDNTAAHRTARQLASDQFRTGAQVLAMRGLSLRGGCTSAATRVGGLAKAVPDLTIILNHIGGLLRVGPYANGTTRCWPPGGAVSPPWQSAPTSRQTRWYRHARTGFDWYTRSKPIGSKSWRRPWLPC
jgi:predicted TIM-barrel fold metal-dependent hydrolase